MRTAFGLVGADFSGGATAVAAGTAYARLGAGALRIGQRSARLPVSTTARPAPRVTGLTRHTTATSLQNGTDPGLSLFVDKSKTDSHLTPWPARARSSASQAITVNTSLLADNKISGWPVPAGGSMGDDDPHANYLLDQLSQMRFGTPQSNISELGQFPARRHRRRIWISQTMGLHRQCRRRCQEQ